MKSELDQFGHKAQPIVECRAPEKDTLDLCYGCPHYGHHRRSSYGCDEKGDPDRPFSFCGRTEPCSRVPDDELYED